MTDQRPDIFGGVDTHADTHHAAVVDPIGRHLGNAQFSGGSRRLGKVTPSNRSFVAFVTGQS
jgi:hypothetical protein